MLNFGGVYVGCFLQILSRGLPKFSGTWWRWSWRPSLRRNQRVVENVKQLGCAIYGFLMRHLPEILQLMRYLLKHFKYLIRKLAVYDLCSIFSINHRLWFQFVSCVWAQPSKDLGEILDIAKPVKRENKFEVSWFNSIWRMHKSYGFMWSRMMPSCLRS